MHFLTLLYTPLHCTALQRVECPDLPAVDYPRAYSLTALTDNWNTDSTELPPRHYDSLCHFNYQNATELRRAHSYRLAERPFVVYNVPEVDEVVRRWSNVDYLNTLLGMFVYVCMLCGVCM